MELDGIYDSRYHNFIRYLRYSYIPLANDHHPPKRATELPKSQTTYPMLNAKNHPQHSYHHHHHCHCHCHCHHPLSLTIGPPIPSSTHSLILFSSSLLYIKSIAYSCLSPFSHSINRPLSVPSSLSNPFRIRFWRALPIDN